jgi:hypothetical protein
MSHIYATKNYAIAHFYFRWTEPDCETLLVDPQGEVYIISKVKNAAAKAAHVPLLRPNIQLLRVAHPNMVLQWDW